MYSCGGACIVKGCNSTEIMAPTTVANGNEVDFLAEYLSSNSPRNRRSCIFEKRCVYRRSPFFSVRFLSMARVFQPERASRMTPTLRYNNRKWYKTKASETKSVKSQIVMDTGADNNNARLRAEEKDIAC
jgi:hypothetical protein